MGETETIAQYLADLNYSSIPTPLIEEMKVILFDYLGVALAGAGTESGRIAAPFSKGFKEEAETAIIRFGYKISALSGAFANAILSHSTELDDVDSLSYIHFSPPIFSAALAMAEGGHASGKDLLVSLVGGCGVTARPSAAITFESAIQRGRSYVEAGVDMIFVEAPFYCSIIPSGCYHKSHATTSQNLKGKRDSGTLFRVDDHFLRKG